MPKPVIFTVDDDPMVLNAIERDLRQRYSQDFRILSLNSARGALEALRQFQARGEYVALFLTDQRMPQMSGTQFLAEAMTIFPAAKKVLLTAYADTEAAIQSINKIALDYYLLKPWSPPDENLYPVLDDLLADWKASARLPYEGIRVAGALWSPQSHAVKDFLARHQIAYQWLDVEKDASGRLLVDEFKNGAHRLPVVVFPDGVVFVEPTLRQMA